MAAYINSADRRGRDGGARRSRRPAVPLLVGLASLLAGCGYGEIHELQERARVARQEIEVQLQRRAELVPSLVETLQAHASVGDETVDSLSDARSALLVAVRSGNFDQMQVANAQLCMGLERMLASATRQVSLETDPAFQLLQSQLEATAEQIEQVGREYNEAVRRFNDFIAGFPQLVTAKVIGAEELEPFEPSAATPVPASSE